MFSYVGIKNGGATDYLSSIVHFINGMDGLVNGTRYMPYERNGGGYLTSS